MSFRMQGISVASNRHSSCRARDSRLCWHAQGDGLSDTKPARARSQEHNGEQGTRFGSNPQSGWFAFGFPSNQPKRVTYQVCIRLMRMGHPKPVLLQRVCKTTHHQPAHQTKIKANQPHKTRPTQAINRPVLTGGPISLASAWKIPRLNPREKRSFKSRKKISESEVAWKGILQAGENQMLSLAKNSRLAEALRWMDTLVKLSRERWCSPSPMADINPCLHDVHRKAPPLKIHTIAKWALPIRCSLCAQSGKISQTSSA